MSQQKKYDIPVVEYDKFSILVGDKQKKRGKPSLSKNA